MTKDFSAYVDLTPLDISPVQIYLDAIETARSVFPNFELRQGTVEDAMFQAFAYMSALNIGSINRLPNSLMLGVGKMLGTQYSDGERATMNVKFTANSNSGATVPSGTLVAFRTPVQEDDGGFSYVFETNSELVISANNLGDELPFGTVAVTSENLGLMPIIVSGSAMSILSYSQQLLAVEAAGTFVQGSSPESLSDFLSRTVSRLGAMSSAITTGAQLRNHIFTQYPNLITQSIVYDLCDPDGSLLLSSSPVPGNIVSIIYGPGRFLTDGEKQTIITEVSAKCVAGLEIGIRNPFLLTFNIVADINYFSNFNVDVVEEIVKQNLLSQFNPLALYVSEPKLRYNSVLRNIYATPGVQNVNTLSISNISTSTITGSIKQKTVTGAVVGGSGSTATITYTIGAHPFVIGDIATVSGITPAGLDCTSAAVTAITSTGFTVVKANATGTYTSGGIAVTTFTTHTAPNSFSNGDRVVVSGITPSTLNSSAITVTSATPSGSGATAAITYTASGHGFIIGDVVTVTGITPSSLNCSDCPVIEVTASTFKVIKASATGTYASGGSTFAKLEVVRRTNTSFTVNNPSGSGVYTSGGTATIKYPFWGLVSGTDIEYLYKGSLFNLAEQNITLTLNSVVD